MRWMIRLGLTAVLTVGMVIVGIRLISYLIEWWYRPPTSGLKLRPTPAESEYLMESSEGKMRIPKEEEQSRLKLDYLDYTNRFRDDRHRTRRWPLLLGIVVSLCIA